jgi:hypothetical protein
MESVWPLSFVPLKEGGQLVSEPDTKEEWRQYFLLKLEAARQRAEAARSEKERAELNCQAESLSAKIRLFDFDASTWWPPGAISQR